MSAPPEGRSLFMHRRLICHKQKKTGATFVRTTPAFVITVLLEDFIFYFNLSRFVRMNETDGSVLGMTPDMTLLTPSQMVRSTC
jgi:hypothetical protein